MKTEPQKNKKLRASILAGVLAVALVLTGTFAWRSISQRTRNEILDVRNPGGRVHDDFSFTAEVKNKDVYVENFTDVESGAPVFARVKLLEYMEMGEDAGIHREKTDAERRATPLVPDSYINEPDTWQVYVPGAEDDPFREYWIWTMGGQTTYMPTFNKNKDSLSVDVNGTYVGKDKDFETGTPYDDYVTYTLGQKVYQEAYYDADDNDVDEYDATAVPAQKPGAGGTRAGAGVADPNYEAVSEYHIAKDTLICDGIVLMSDWVADGMPICNKWVYDDSEDGGGWFYWPEPILPQTATGLLLDKVDQRKSAGDRSYYAIEVVGQFASVDPVDGWGTKATADAEATGFYVDGLSEGGKALLDKAAQVVVASGRWYLPEAGASNLYREIRGDEGRLSELISAGMDRLIGTVDDREDVQTAEGDAITIDGQTYSKYYLPPTEAEPFYRVCAPGGELGSKDDVLYWMVGGGTFPGTGDDLTTNPVTGVTVTAQNSVTQVLSDSDLTFTARVTTAEGLTNTAVTWSVSGGKKNGGTTIDPETGVLHVGSEEVGTPLTVTATSKLDPRRSGSATVRVVDTLVTVKINDGAHTVRVNGSLELTPTVEVSESPIENPGVLWAVVGENNSEAPEGVTITRLENGSGKLTVPNNSALEGQKLYVTASYTAAEGSETSAPFEVTIISKDELQVTVNLPTTLSGGTVAAGVSDAPFTMRVTSTAGGTVPEHETVWSVTTTSPSERSASPFALFAARSVDDGTKVTIDSETGKLNVGRRVPAGTLITVTCTVNYTDPDTHAARSASSFAELTVAGPARVEVVGPDQVEQNTKNLVLKATLKNADGSTYSAGGDNIAIWTLSGASKPGTKIDRDTGVLTVAVDEPLNTVLTVTAAAAVDTSITGTKTLSVTKTELPTSVTIADPGPVRRGDVIPLDATVMRYEEKCSNQAVYWSMTGAVSENTKITNGGVLTVGWDEPGGQAGAGTGSDLTITATSAIGGVVGTRTIKVTNCRPSDIVITPDTMMVKAGVSVDFNATVKIGNGGDHNNQVVTWGLTGNTESGTTIDNTGLLTVSGDEPVGTVLTVSATSNAAGANLTVTHRLIVTNAGVTAVKITNPVNNTAQRPRGSNTYLRAEVMRSETDLHSDQGVIWTLTGGQKPGTRINENNVLTIDPGETATSLTIQAASGVDPSVKSDPKTITVIAGAMNGNKLTAYNIFTDSKGEKWFVLSKNGTKKRAVLIRWNALGTPISYPEAAGWKDTYAQIYLNGTYYDSIAPEVKAAILPVTLNTPKSYSANPEYVQTTDRVFLPSEADVFYERNGTALPHEQFSISNVGYMYSDSTEYSIPATLEDGTTKVPWLLRVPPEVNNTSTKRFVKEDGTCFSEAVGLGYKLYMRPVIYIQFS